MGSTAGAGSSVAASIPRGANGDVFTFLSNGQCSHNKGRNPTGNASSALPGTVPLPSRGFVVLRCASLRGPVFSTIFLWPL